MSGSGTGTPISTALPTPLQTLQDMVGGAYTITQLQRALDGAYSMLISTLGHAFGDAFTIYCSATNAATSTFTVNSSSVVLTVDDTEYEFPFADYPTLGSLLAAIKETGLFTAKLVDVVLPSQASANLATVSAQNIMGSMNRYVAKLKQWTECLSGNNQHILTLSMPALSIVSVTEDGNKLTENVDFEFAGVSLARVCAYGNKASCWRMGYWSCAAPCNVCITYVPLWFGDYPEAFITALYGFAQLMLEVIATGHYDSEQIGDYRYDRGRRSSESFAQYYMPLCKYQITPRLY